MAHLLPNGSGRRANPFARSSASPSPGPQPVPSRPKSALFSTSGAISDVRGHSRNASSSQLGSAMGRSFEGRQRSNSTFAPPFIKSEELRKGADQIRGIEGDNDFSG